MSNGGELIPFNRESLEIIERKAHIEGSAIVQSATALVISDAPSFVAAGELRKEVNTKDGILEREFKPIKQALDAAKKRVIEFENRARGPFQEARRIIDGKCVDWNKEQKRIQEEEQDRQRKEAQKLEDDRKQREAEHAVKMGATQEQALAILEQPSSVPTPAIQSAVPKVSGMSFTERWDYELDSLTDLVMFAAMHPELTAQLIQVNDVGCRALARSQKDALAIPGIHAVKKEGVAGSRH